MWSERTGPLTSKKKKKISVRVNPSGLYPLRGENVLMSLTYSNYALKYEPDSCAEGKVRGIMNISLESPLGIIKRSLIFHTNLECLFSVGWTHLLHDPSIILLLFSQGSVTFFHDVRAPLEQCAFITIVMTFLFSHTVHSPQRCDRK